MPVMFTRRRGGAEKSQVSKVALARLCLSWRALRANCSHRSRLIQWLRVSAPPCANSGGWPAAAVRERHAPNWSHWTSRKRAHIAVFAAVLIIATSSRAGTVSEVAFADYTPLSSNAELARRMLSPLTAAQLPQILAQKNGRLAEQPVNVVQERFVVFVPSSPAPPRGYGLIVFVPPWDKLKIPDGWAPVLDQAGFVFVSAAQSGNEATALGRREPLALLGETNVAKRWPIDSARVYVAGFSGGSRIAMRLALGYPDVFRGAILNSGGDTIGNATIPIPPKDLFREFQEKSRLIYVTGARDIFVTNAVNGSIRSMREWCQFHVENRVMPSAGHETIDASSLSRALDALAAPLSDNAGNLASCRADIESQVDTQLAQAQSFFAAGQRDAALKLMTDIDSHFGGLAVPKSVELVREAQTGK